MLNKRGYVLVYAIGILSLLILLTATLTNLTMSRTLWVDKNVKNIKDISKANMQIEAASSELINYFDTNLFENVISLSVLQADIQREFNEIQNNYDVIIRDLTVEPCEYPVINDLNPCYDVNTDSTYAYDIIYVNEDIVAQRKFFLSTIPSYLYYALGSKTDMTINGGAYVLGDMYVDRNLYLADTTNYILDSSLYQKNSTFLTVDTTNNIYFGKSLINKPFYSCKNNIIPCYDIETDPTKFLKSPNKFVQITESFEIPTTFSQNPPKIKYFTEKFVDINFDKSYTYYIGESIKDSSRTIDINNLNTEFGDFISENLLNEVDSLNQYLDPTQSIIVREPVTVIDHNFSFNKDEWVIIDGDLKIEKRDIFNTIFIDANFIVTGNISISGDVQINSTTYSLGSGLIHSASINSSDHFDPTILKDNQLVLLTKGNMQFSAINEFDNDFSKRFDELTGEFNPDIRGFFYSEGSVSIYTSNSYLTLEGGIFSNDINNHSEDTTYIDGTDSVGLLINSYRGEVRRSAGDFIFLPPESYLESRFVIKYSPDIILNQPKGLPISEKANYFFEDIIIN